MPRGNGTVPPGGRLNMAFGERLLQRIDACAWESGIGRTEFIRRATEELCANHEQQADMRRRLERAGEREYA